jgi:PIN domain nuclease of toxin-antitoxin system
MMRLLLDTQIIYRIYYEPVRLPSRARQLMMEATEILVSSASIWEIAIKARLGKIGADPELLVEKIEASGIQELPVLYRHALQVVNLPLHHADPFDRLLIAQTMQEQLWLLTTDAQLSRYTDLVLHIPG